MYTILHVATKIGQFAQEMARLNPWWRDPRWAGLDPDLREVAGTGLHYRAEALDNLEAGGLYILRGPRRVGKTVAVKQRVQRLIDQGVPPTSIISIAADGWAAKDLRTVVQNVALPPVPPGVERTWLIDEISSVAGAWDQQIKWLRDNDPSFRASTVVLTGSNATALTDAAGVLAGRRGQAARTDRMLLPVGFRTFARLTAREDLPALPRLEVSGLRSAAARDQYQHLIPWIDVLVQLWELYLTYGGFPRSVAAATAGDPLPQSFVDDVFHVIAGDAFRHSKLNPATEMALLERLWAGMAAPANLSSIGKDVDVSNNVVARHVGYLYDAYLLWYCPQRAEGRWIAREKAQDKLYAIDPLVARLPHLRNAARADIDPTVLAEMQIGMALRRNIIDAHPTAVNDEFLFHVRTATRKEIDFLAYHLGGVAIEGKYTEGGSWASEAATVNASEWDGLLCTRTVLDLDGDDAWAVPAAFVAYLIDT